MQRWEPSTRHRAIGEQEGKVVFYRVPFVHVRRESGQWEGGREGGIMWSTRVGFT